MSRTTQRMIALQAVFWILGPAVVWMFRGLRAPDGGPDISMLMTQPMWMGLGATLLAAGLACAAAAAAAAAFGARSGIFAAGLVMVWPAWAAGSIEGILRRTQSASTLWLLALEGLFIGLIIAGIGIIVLRGASTSGLLTAPRSKADASRLTMQQLASAALVGLAAAAVGAHAVARNELPAQTIAATFTAGLLGAIGATLLAPGISPALILVGLAPLAAIGPAASAIIDGAAIINHLYEGSMLPLGRPTPLQWLAGLCLGVPVGASWAAGLVKRE